MNNGRIEHNQAAGAACDVTYRAMLCLAPAWLRVTMAGSVKPLRGKWYGLIRCRLWWLPARCWHLPLVSWRTHPLAVTFFSCQCRRYLSAYIQQILVVQIHPLPPGCVDKGHFNNVMAQHNNLTRLNHLSSPLWIYPNQPIILR
ncbi:Uncharacterised protein [Yersinia similis]|nr:Uncharacterised protein [Yersinia similis]